MLAGNTGRCRKVSHDQADQVRLPETIPDNTSSPHYLADFCCVEILFSRYDCPPCANPALMGGAGAHYDASALQKLEIFLSIVYR